MTVQMTGVVTNASLDSDNSVAVSVVMSLNGRTYCFNVPVQDAKNWVVGNAVHLTMYSYTPPPAHATSV